MKRRLIVSIIICLNPVLYASESPGGWIIGWGSNINGEATGISPFKFSTNRADMLAQFKDPQISRYSAGTVTVAGQIVSNATAISCGVVCPFALKNDGRVIGWGTAGRDTNRGNEFSPPPDLNDVNAITGGQMHNLAIKNDGTVSAWGEKRYGALSMPDGLTNVVAVAACGNNSLALRKDGTLVGWGENVKIPPGISNIMAISSSPGLHTAIGRPGEALALKKDGTVVLLKWNDGASEVSTVDGLSNVVAIASGPVHNLALKKDGTVYAWGFNRFQTLDQPPRLTNIVAIAASGTSFPASGYSLALKNDGHVVAWGTMNLRPATVPEGLTDVVAISAGPGFCLAITTNAAVAEKFRQK